MDGSGSNSFVRALVTGLGDLYGLEDGITPENWEALDAEIRRRHADSGWAGEVMRRAGVERIVTDPYLEPSARCSEGSGRRVSIGGASQRAGSRLAPEVRDHNGNSGHDFARALGAELDTFDDYVAFLEYFVDTLGDSAPGRPEERSRLRPRSPFRRARRGARPPRVEKEAPSPEEQKAFGDYVVDRLCALAGERGVPIQMHLGTALIRGSHPMYAAGLVERHPGTRFLLMHLGYPWSRDLLGMAFVYRNIWLDLTWSFMLSPSHFKLALHEAIEILPDESRLMLGGDGWHVEESYGALALGRRLIGEVLHERMQAGFLSEEGSRRLARRILHENARAFFGADLPSFRTAYVTEAIGLDGLAAALDLEPRRVARGTRLRAARRSRPPGSPGRAVRAPAAARRGSWCRRWRRSCAARRCRRGRRRRDRWRGRRGNAASRGARRRTRSGWPDSIAEAARAARSAWSGWSPTALKTAITASPAKRSIVAPSRSELRHRLRPVCVQHLDRLGGRTRLREGREALEVGEEDRHLSLDAAELARAAGARSRSAAKPGETYGRNRPSIRLSSSRRALEQRHLVGAQPSRAQLLADRVERLPRSSAVTMLRSASAVRSSTCSSVASR